MVRPSPIFPALILAIALHWLLFQLDFVSNPVPEDSAPITIEKWEEGGERAVVQSEQAKKSEESKKPAEFAGEFKQRVKKQTKSPVTGPLSSARPLQGGGGKSQRTDPDGEVPEGTKGPDMKDLLVFGARPNQLGEEIAEGPQTLLNTDPVLYASFINRIAEEIYDPWVQYAKLAAREIYVQGSELVSKTYITKISVVVNKKGEVLSVGTVQGSGVRGLDEAPKKAFWKTEPFPNPPEQMFDSDGMARFIYEFHFQWKDSAFNIVPLI